MKKYHTCQKFLYILGGEITAWTTDKYQQYERGNILWFQKTLQNEACYFCVGFFGLGPPPNRQHDLTTETWPS